MSPLLTKDCICFSYVCNMFIICHTVINACNILPSLLSGKEGSILHLDLQQCIIYIFIIIMNISNLYGATEI